MNENEIKSCFCCGCVIDPADESYTTKDGDIICEDCCEREYVMCEECGEYVREDDATYVDDTWVCPDCLTWRNHYYRCDDCGEWHSWDNVSRYETGNGNEICEECFERDYSVCECCDEIYPNEDMELINGDAYCPDCASRQHRSIRDYSYKPSPVFKTIHDVFFSKWAVKELVFGVELEVDEGHSPEDCAAELLNISEDIYCKHDGSLSDGGDGGIEIVTHPCSLEYHMTKLPWERLAQECLDWDFMSHNTSTCGLHIHVGTEQMGPDRDDVKAKLVLLTDRFWDQLVVFSRRKASALRDWAKRPEFKYGGNENDTIRNALASRYYGRYQAVNLTNRDTVEFRLFRGTLKVSTILASIQLVNNMVKYAMDHTVDEVRASQWKEVALYESYPQLQEYLEEKELVEVGELAPNEYQEVARKFKLGDYVKVRSYAGLNAGQIARVVRYAENGENVGIDFGEVRPGCHTLGGFLRCNTGRYYHMDDLDLVTAAAAALDEAERAVANSMVNEGGNDECA